MIVNFFRNLKTTNLLRIFNELRWRHFLAHYNYDRIIAIIVVPGLEHLCVPCIRLLSPFYNEVIIVNNGLQSDAFHWLKAALPNIPIFKIVTSIQGKYILSHGDALDLLSRAPADIVFVDPDCYVFQSSLIAQIYCHLKNNAIVSLYSYPCTTLGFSIPDTFCFGVQSRALSCLRKIFSLRIGGTPQLSPPLLDHAVQYWGNPVPFPHPFKDYFDTIHSLAIAAHLANMGIKVIPSTPEQVFHVLGTSYQIRQLQNPGIEVDMLALNAQYFHCLVAEAFNMNIPCKAVLGLVEHYGGSGGILMKFPAYCQSPQRSAIDLLFSMLRDRYLFSVIRR